MSESSKASPSLYEQVMSDPVAKHLYENVTKGTLAGRRDDPSVVEVRKVLDELEIPYLFNHDAHRPRPIWMSKQTVLAGTKAIISHANELNIRRATNKLCEYGCCY